MSGHLRVPLVTPGTNPELAEVEGRIMAERGRVSLLYQVLLNSGPIASGWERMLTAVRNQTCIPADLRELIILRVAVLNRAAFEFEAHAPIARREGVSEEKIAAVKENALSSVFAPEEALVLELTDAMTREINVPDTLFTRLREIFDDKGLVEVVATVAAYNMVSRFLVALNISH
ncbi:MAG: carboxymuconolactone decarboxylase family protein [Proteobacteria bacterium]|nr:carboxymuconolactone decarboxylase family protein [Pseudomonadota bacterium]